MSTRVLVLGGTVFLSEAVARAAVLRGHEVVCACRGSSGAVPAGAELVRWDRDQPGPSSVGRSTPWSTWRAAPLACGRR